MPATPTTVEDFLSLLGKSGLIPQDDLNQRLEQLRAQGSIPETASGLAKVLVQEGMLTPFHTSQLLAGKSRGFLLGTKYKVLERLGSGGMGAVYLCQHVVMRRLVAVKILPVDQANSEAALERFHREARAVAQLDHPNIVRAHDVDQEGKLHFLVMEFVDGNTLDRIVRKGGRLTLLRACHYIRQAAEGLQHAHEAGLVHRDIKPANLLLGPDGILKILDMGLARFFHDSDDNLTRDHEAHSMLGTADYMAPEQAINSSEADIRADLYSLGATFYFLLAGESPFAGRSTAQKLMMHQFLTPTRIRDVCPDVPQEIDDLIATLLEKDPALRLQTPAEVAAALVPWTETPIPIPDDSEMPTWPPAIRNLLRIDSPSGSRPSQAKNAGEGASDSANPASGGSGKRTRGLSGSEKRANGSSSGSSKGSVSPETTSAAEPTRTDPARPEPEHPQPSPAIQSASRIRKIGRNRPAPASLREAGALPAGNAPAATLDTPAEPAISRPKTAASTGLSSAFRSPLVLCLAGGVLLVLLGLGVGIVWWFSQPGTPPGKGQEVVVIPPHPDDPLQVKPPRVEVPNPQPVARLEEIKPQRRLEGHAGDVESVCFCIDGQRMLSTSRDRTMRLWDVASGTEVRKFIGHDATVYGVAVLPDGQRALSCSGDRSIRLWNLLTAEEILRFSGHADAVHNVACLPDGTRFLSASKDQTVRLWDIKTGQEIKRFEGHTGAVFGLDVSHDGLHALSGGEDRTVRLWDLKDGKEIARLTVPDSVSRVKFSNDARQAIVACGAAVLRWDVVARPKQGRPLDGPTGQATAAVFTENGKHVLGGGEDGLARIWDVSQGKQQFLLTGHTDRVLDVAASPDGRHVATGGADKTILLWQLPRSVEGIYVGETRLLAGHKDAIEQVAFLPDGRRVISSSLDKTMCLWEVATGKLIRRFEGHAGKLRGMIALPDGHRAITAGFDKTARLWDLETGKEIRKFEGHKSGVHWLSCSADGRRLLTSGDDGTIRLWEIETGKQLKFWQAYTGRALTVAFVPGGQRVVTGGTDKGEQGKELNIVKLWDLDKAQLIEQKAQNGTVWRVDMSPDGRLAATTDGKTVSLWDLATGRVRAIDVKDMIAAAVFSPDGRFLLVGVHDGTVRLLDTATGKEKCRLEKHMLEKQPKNALGTAFSPNGRLAVSGGRDNMVRIWQLPEYCATKAE